MTDQNYTNSSTLAKPGALVDINAERQPVVFAQGEDVFTNSRDVASYFGKNHRDVLRAIRNLVDQEPELGLRNFAPFKNNDLTGESTSHYDMDREGFELLAMGFTGAKALKWKRAYIKAFKALEDQFRKPRLVIDFSDPKVMLGVYEHLQQQVAEKDHVIAAQAEKVKKLDRIEAAAGTLSLQAAAKTLNARPSDLIAFMAARRWIYKRVGNTSWLAYQDKLQSGYLEHADHMFFDSQGRERVSTRALVTGKGLVKLADLLNQPLH